MRLPTPLLSILSLPLLLPFANAWLVTDYYQLSYYSGCTRTTTNRNAYCYSFTDRVTPTATTITPTGGTPFSTTVNTYDRLTRVAVLLPTDAPGVTYSSYRSPDFDMMTMYYLKTTIEPPESCKRSYTRYALEPIVTQVAANVPLAAEHLVEATSTSTSVRTGGTMTYIYKYIKPTAPAMPTRTYSRYCFEFTVGASRTTPTSSSDSDSGSGSSRSDLDFFNSLPSPEKKAAEGLLAGIIFLIVWVFFFLLLGFIEAYLNFQQAMLGLTHYPGGPPLSWLFALGIVPAVVWAWKRGIKPIPARASEAERNALRTNWISMSPETKNGLFWRHAFSSKPIPAVEAALVAAGFTQKPEQGGTAYNPGGYLNSPQTLPTTATPAPSYHPPYSQSISTVTGGGGADGPIPAHTEPNTSYFQQQQHQQGGISPGLQPSTSRVSSVSAQSVPPPPPPPPPQQQYQQHQQYQPEPPQGYYTQTQTAPQTGNFYPPPLNAPEQQQQQPQHQHQRHEPVD